MGGVKRDFTNSTCRHDSFTLGTYMRYNDNVCVCMFVCGCVFQLKSYYQTHQTSSSFFLSP
eukprot:NODE_1804_length_837_cov_97.598985_g1423_i0.p2 GENE.NODE_1804_length_837_cov_97.598985_g1423_i0~~NODE_1804_length_837_cov_97.598985_g1423_i0.p2  ORF type:complete len:61 (-),score=8.57 NODE_1804_length_837_cov_97.598985_g1423_i0:627-809(-)